MNVPPAFDRLQSNERWLRVFEYLGIDPTTAVASSPVLTYDFYDSVVLRWESVMVLRQEQVEAVMDILFKEENE